MIDSLLLIIDPLHGDKLMSLIFFFARVDYYLPRQQQLFEKER